MFEVGDQVRVTTDFFGDYKGLEGVIKRIEGGYCRVSLLGSIYRSPNEPFPFTKEELELVLPKLPDWRL